MIETFVKLLFSTLFSFLLLFISPCQSASQPLKIKLGDICLFSKALNIEGLSKIKGANLRNEKMITAYFTQVLDTPGKIIKYQSNGVELNERIHASPRGGRMENEIIEFHEERANLFWLIVLQIYIENAHSFTKKDKTKPVFITIHLHRGKSAVFHMDLLRRIFVEFFNVPAHLITRTSFNGIPMMKFKIDHKNVYITIQGDRRHTHKIYNPAIEPCDIFLAFGFVGALDPNLSSGDVVLPTSSFDFNPESLTISFLKETKGNNHLLKVLPLYINRYQTESVLRFVNERLFSPYKPRKKTEKFKINEIRELKILAVNHDFFLPSKLKEKCGKNFEKRCVTVIK
jgi:hypothetical protein